MATFIRVLIATILLSIVLIFLLTPFGLIGTVEMVIIALASLAISIAVARFRGERNKAAH